MAVCHPVHVRNAWPVRRQASTRIRPCFSCLLVARPQSPRQQPSGACRLADVVTVRGEVPAHPWLRSACMHRPLPGAMQCRHACSVGRQHRQHPYHTQCNIEAFNAQHKACIQCSSQASRPALNAQCITIHSPPAGIQCSMLRVCQHSMGIEYSMPGAKKKHQSMRLPRPHGAAKRDLKSSAEASHLISAPQIGPIVSRFTPPWER